MFSATKVSIFTLLAILFALPFQRLSHLYTTYIKNFCFTLHLLALRNSRATKRKNAPETTRSAEPLHPHTHVQAVRRTETAQISPFFLSDVPTYHTRGERARKGRKKGRQGQLSPMASPALWNVRCMYVCACVFDSSAELLGGSGRESGRKNLRGRGERKKSRVGVPFLVHHPYKSHIEINVFIVKVSWACRKNLRPPGVLKFP